MSEAPKSTWLVANWLRPMIELCTCQLIFNPNSVLDVPTHSWMAAPAKLEPVDCMFGLAPAGRAPQSCEAPSTTRSTAVTAAARTPRLGRSAELTVDIVERPLVGGISEDGLGAS